MEASEKHFWMDFATTRKRKLLANFGELYGTFTNIFSKNIDFWQLT